MPYFAIFMLLFSLVHLMLIVAMMNDFFNHKVCHKIKIMADQVIVTNHPEKILSQNKFKMFVMYLGPAYC